MELLGTMCAEGFILMSPSELLHRTVRAMRHFSGVGRARNYRQLRTAIVLNVPTAVAHTLTRLQLDILRRQGINLGLAAAPHLTLKLGFLCHDVQTVADFLVDFASRTPAVPVQLNGCGSFDDGILFAEVVPSEELHELRYGLLTELQERFGIEPYALEGDAFHFHVTLAYGLSRKAFVQERAWLAHQALNHAFVGQELALMCLMDNHWFTYRQVPLQAVESLLSV